MPLTPVETTLLRLSVAVVRGDWPTLRQLRRSAGPGQPNLAWREAVLQSHLFAGFPRLVEAYGVLESEGGLGTPGPEERRAEGDQPERGGELFRLIYAEQAPAVRATLERFHPDYADWILGHAYGRVLCRPGLEPQTRELLAVACLAALGQDRQLASHVRGALHCGADAETLFEVLDATADLIEEPHRRRTRRVLESFATSRGA